MAAIRLCGLCILPSQTKVRYLLPTQSKFSLFEASQFSRVMFDYSHHMKNLVADISCRCGTFGHIDADRILVGISRSRNKKRHGLQAKLMPLRFQGGLKTTRSEDCEYYEMPPVVHAGRDILYVIYFCLPRFQNLSFKAKLTTIFHELYHINPDFNGDIRRFAGRFYQHSHSEKEYDKVVEALSKEYLAAPETKGPTEFLRLRYEELCRNYGEVGGLRIRVPDPVPLAPKQALLFEPD